MTRQGAASLDDDTTRKFLKCIGRWPPFDLCPILARVRVTRMEQRVVERGFVRQQQQAFRIGIEAADWVHVAWKSEFGERAMRRILRREAGEDAVRFVKRQDHGAKIRRLRYRLVRRRSKISGWGVFAGEPITKNSRIIDYAGEKVSRRVSGARERRQNARGEVWCFIVDRHWVRDAEVGGNIARFINHACKPNCYVDIAGDVIWIRASRNIKTGEELTYDYRVVPPLGISCRCRPGCEAII